MFGWGRLSASLFRAGCIIHSAAEPVKIASFEGVFRSGGKCPEWRGARHAHVPNGAARGRAASSVARKSEAPRFGVAIPVGLTRMFYAIFTHEN